MKKFEFESVECNLRVMAEKFKRLIEENPGNPRRVKVLMADEILYSLELIKGYELEGSGSADNVINEAQNLFHTDEASKVIKNVATRRVAEKLTDILEGLMNITSSNHPKGILWFDRDWLMKAIIQILDFVKDIEPIESEEKVHG